MSAPKQGSVWDPGAAAYVAGLVTAALIKDGIATPEGIEARVDDEGATVLIVDLSRFFSTRVAVANVAINVVTSL